MALAYARTHGLDVGITRCCNNYGPYQFPEKVIPLFVTNLLDGRRSRCTATGGNVRDWMHVDDHCRGIQLALERGRAGRGLPHRRRHGADQHGADRRPCWTAAARAGTWSTPVEDRKGHDRRYSLDDSALRGAGLRPAHPVRRGAGGHRAVVPGEPRLVGAAEGGRAASQVGGAGAGATARHDRWLVTGAGGMLGRDLVAVLGRRGEDVTGLTAPGARHHRRRRRPRALARRRPDVVVNCAAWTAVDDAEAQRGRGARGQRPGRGEPGGRVRGARGARLVQLSTDYVFSGEPRRPTRRTTRTGAAHRLRAHQAGRRAGGARAAARDRLRGADRVAVRGARAELRRAR